MSLPPLSAVPHLLLQLGLVITAAVLLARLARLARLPPLLGMIVGGFLVALCWSPPEPAAAAATDVSATIRLAVLAVLLLKAGVGLSLADLRSAGGLALRLGLLPMVAEATAVALLGGVLLLKLPLGAAICLGLLVAPISPAIVIPGVLRLLERAGGAARQVPAALLAGAPIDNITAVIALGVAIDFATGQAVAGGAAALALARQIGVGVGAGLAVGLLLAAPLRHRQPLLGEDGGPDRAAWLATVACLAAAGGLILAGRALGFSFVLAILTLGLTLRARAADAAPALAMALDAIWVLSQFALFGLIGAAVDPAPLAVIGPAAVATIALGQLGRAGGSLLATAGTGLDRRTRLACVLTYVPKATIQAAFASLPLDRGLAAGGVLLAVAVLAIAITAPLGTVALERGVAPLLTSPEE